MRVLWLVNSILPAIANHRGVPVFHKEGWLSGLCDGITSHPEDGCVLGVLYPSDSLWQGKVSVNQGELYGYSFVEDTVHPERLKGKDRAAMERRFRQVWEEFQPDVVHCFGTEYAHSMVFCQAYPYPERIVIHIQGLCMPISQVYFAGIEESAVKRVTLRDFLKQDSMVQQQRKFYKRGLRELQALEAAGNVSGRTHWDRYHSQLRHPGIEYFTLNETLRGCFYEGQWEKAKAKPHSIFMSQGDYPIKGFHTMLKAMGRIVKEYPDATLTLAGPDLTRETTIKDKLKVPGYGRYLQELIERHGLQGRVTVLGRISAEEMKQAYLSSDLYVCPSAIDNSPNSLGEAMLLGMPCIARNVGGVASIFTGGVDGILLEPEETSCLYESGVSMPEFFGAGRAGAEEKSGYLQGDDAVAEKLGEAVLYLWKHPELEEQYCQNARAHARRTHNPEKNYQDMMEIYRAVFRRKPMVVMVSNYINHHQIPFCDEMNRLLEGNFRFIQVMPMEEERVRMGWQREELPEYVELYYEKESWCQSLIDSCEVLIFGGLEDERYIQKRLESNKPVIRYTERLYKEGRWKWISPRGLLKKYKDHTRHSNKRVYLLCAGAYVSGDFEMIKAYKDKRLVWGYFPAVKEQDIAALMAAKEEDPISILWVGRMIPLKHPEVAVEVAKVLKERGISFRLTMIGDGEARELVEQRIEQYGLQEQVALHGFMSPGEVRKYMERACIYLFTSNRIEGWGAVLNEAMNSGCAVLANHIIGSARYMIQDGENGFLYQDGNIDQLCNQVLTLCKDKEYRVRMGKKGYETVRDFWNPQYAAKTLLEIMDSHMRAGKKFPREWESCPGREPIKPGQGAKPLSERYPKQ